MASKAKRARKRPSRPPEWDPVSDLPDTPAARANVVVEQVEQHRKGKKRAKKVPLYEIWLKRGWLTKAQVKAAEAILKAHERRTASGGQAINPTKVDISPNPHASAELLLRKCQGLDPMDLVPIRYKQAVSLVVLSNIPCGSGRMDALRSGLDWVAERL